MRRMWTAALAITLVAVSMVAGERTGQVYGEGVTLSEPVPIATLIAQPDGFVGKKVRVDGVVSAVCEHRGCWMKVTDPASEQGIRIKVEDGVIVFPASAVGKKASAEGVFEKIRLPSADAETTPRGVAESEAHQAACAGETAAETVLLIRGTGAVIY